MDNEKNDDIIKKTDSNEFDEYSNENYYEDLYNDLPKEVVELLMKTHPLLSKEDSEKAVERFHTKYGGAEEIAEVRRAVNEEAKKQESPEAEEEKGLIVGYEKDEYIPKRAKREEDSHKNGMEGNKIIEEDYDDRVQVVKHKIDTKRTTHSAPAAPASRKAKEPAAEEIDVAGRFEVKEAIDEGFEYTKKEKPRKNKVSAKVPKNFEMDLDKYERARNLDEFFDDDEDYEEEKKMNFPGGRNFVIICLTVGICLLGFLAFRTVTLQAKLTKADAESQELTEVKAKNEELKLENVSLKEELDKYKSGETPVQGEGEPAPENVEGQTQTPATPSGTDNNAASGNAEYDTYTVQDGDRIWNISEKVYGNGAYYQKILDANGLTENSVLKIGQQLKIPKQ